MSHRTLPKGIGFDKLNLRFLGQFKNWNGLKSFKRFRLRFHLKFVSVLFLLLTVAAQCRQPLDFTEPTPNPEPPSPTSTPVLNSPIPPGDGTDLLDRLLEKGIIRVGIRVWPEAAFSPPAFRGFSNAATGGALNGLEVDVAHYIADGLGLELELVEAYPPIISSGDWRGEWDIAMASLVPFDQIPENSAAPLAYSIPYATMPSAILVPAAGSIQTVSQLSGKKVGVFEHSAYQRLLTPADIEPTVQGQPLLTSPPADIQLIVLSNVQKVIRNMGLPPEERPAIPVDAIYGPAPVFQQAIAENELPLRIITDPERLPPHPLTVAAVSRDGLKTERLLAEINAILTRLNRSGALPETHLRWYNQDLSRTAQE